MPCIVGWPPQGPLAACAGALDRCGAQLTSVAQIKAPRPTSWNWANYGIVVMGLRTSRTVDTAAIGGSSWLWKRHVSISIADGS